jgi:hypothetical protein
VHIHSKMILVAAPVVHSLVNIRLCQILLRFHLTVSPVHLPVEYWSSAVKVCHPSKIARTAQRVSLLGRFIHRPKTLPVVHAKRKRIPDTRGVYGGVAVEGKPHLPLHDGRLNGCSVNWKVVNCQRNARRMIDDGLVALDPISRPSLYEVIVSAPCEAAL